MIRLPHLHRRSTIIFKMVIFLLSIHLNVSVPLKVQFCFYVYIYVSTICVYYPLVLHIKAMIEFRSRKLPNTKLVILYSVNSDKMCWAFVFFIYSRCNYGLKIESDDVESDAYSLELIECSLTKRDEVDRTVCADGRRWRSVFKSKFGWRLACLLWNIHRKFNYTLIWNYFDRKKWAKDTI